jgi:putative glutamine amidotransferase
MERAGLIPIMVAPLTHPGDVEPILDVVDGLILTGGEDVDPALYGQEEHPTTGPVLPIRDATEIALARGARERGIPTLGICRGMQVVNVAFGGTLIQDIPSMIPGALDHFRLSERWTRVHDVKIEPDSALAGALGESQIGVNSFHHQSVDRVATILRATAVAPDGVIEGVESVDPDWWMLGVQWHTEELTETPEPWDRGLFTALREAIADTRVEIVV